MSIIQKSHRENIRIFAQMYPCICTHISRVVLNSSQIRILQTTLSDLWGFCYCSCRSLFPRAEGQGSLPTPPGSGPSVLDWKALGRGQKEVTLPTPRAELSLFHNSSLLSGPPNKRPLRNQSCGTRQHCPLGQAFLRPVRER